MGTDTIQGRKTGILPVIFAWISILAISDLPDIIAKYTTGAIPHSLFWYKTWYLCFFLALCILIRKISRLLPFAIIMLAFYLALAASDLIRTSQWWIGLIGENSKPSFFLLYLRPFLRDILVMLVVMIALFMVKKKRSRFFLVKGQIDAPIQPVRWLGIGQGESWRKFGWIFAVIAAMAVAVPSILSLKPSAALMVRCLPLIPVAMLYAAINAFNEELYFRSTLLSTLPEVIGKTHTLILNVLFFGLAHFLYGSPSGITGLMMTGFLAYLLGKSMLETKGFFIFFLM
jgi:membrane protease YdiL (CAAX protease family)